jgi:hypothetical protein
LPKKVGNDSATTTSEPFHHTAATDHHGIFLDLATEQAFGGHTNTLETANQRTLQTKSRLATIAYIRAAASHGNENNLFEQLFKLKDSADRNDALIERLDDILGQCCTTGEHSCSRIRTGDWKTKIEKFEYGDAVYKTLSLRYATIYCKTYYRPCLIRL